MQNYWNFHDTKMKELKQLYNKTSKATQNNLQALFDTFNFTSENLYNIADNETKARINNYIEQWKDEGLLTGNFKTLANSVYNRIRVKNSEILELLIYSAYMEEQAKLKDNELSILYNDANYYYQEGQKEVIKSTNNKKKPSILEEALFLYLMQQANYSGFTFEQYIQATIQYNAQQIYKQAVIDITQDKELKTNSDEFQRLFNQQNNQKLCINGDKISGSIDLHMVGLNNQAKVEGIKKLSEDDSKVKFIAVTDENSTDMCQSMNEKEFYINKENVFDRYWGETKSELRLMQVKCKGLVLGVCLPPISHHFHYCRSYIMYLPAEVDKKYNIFSSKIEKEFENKYKIQKVRINNINKKVLSNILNNMEKVYDDFPSLKEKISKIEAIEHPYGGMNIEPSLNDDTYIMQINKKFFSDEKIAEEKYNESLKKGFHPVGTTYKDIGIHELGHSVTYEIIKNKYNIKKDMVDDWNKDITAKEIVNKAFTNLEIDDKITKTFLRNSISKYATQSYSETIGEAFADYYANKEGSKILSREIIKIMKGMI